MSRLVLIESPGKLKSFKKILGDGYEVLATGGHCIDLPEKKLSVDIKDGFEPTMAILPGKEAVVKLICSAAKKSSIVYLMTDCDREGEGISWNLYNELQKATKAPIHRASTNEITKAGIEKALANPRDIDMNMVDAYLTRRILDRICGYKTSYLVQKSTGGRSAGRVQSAVLRILVEREKEIMHFVPEEYWVITATFLTDKGETYEAKLDEKIKLPNEATATKVFDEVKEGSPVVASVEMKEVSVNPYAPFTTNTLIQAASGIFGWNTDKTMKVAQGLYETGSISYHRTDSPAMASEAIEAVREVIGSIGHAYLPAKPNFYSAKAGAQEGHECCRPTHFEVKSVGAGDESKLYTLIWKRAVASQMTPGRDQRLRVVTQCAHPFISNGNIRLFDGYRKVWDYGSSEDVILPTLAQGQKTSLKDLQKEQKFTVAPPRYTDGSLNKKCEKEQITRPATFKNCIETLKKRGYINAKGKSFTATDLGISVVDFLVHSDMCFVNIQFTADMEEKLDQIADEKMSKTVVLGDFWKRLKEDIDRAKQVKSAAQVTTHVCPKCGANLLKKHSKWGPFYSCSNYSNKQNKCEYSAKIGENGEPVEKVAKPKEYADFLCKNCGGKMVKRTSKYGDFVGCINFPKCRATADLDGNFKDPSKKKWKGKKKDGNE